MQSCNATEVIDLKKSKVDSGKRVRSRPIILTGLPGSGKSTVARILSRLLLAPSLDMDLAYAEKFGMTPSQAIIREGEPSFRRKERNLLLENVGYDPLVISAGGGTLTHEETLSLAMKRGIVVYLNTPAAVAASRLGTALNHPLLEEHDLEGSMARLLSRRRRFYQRSLMSVSTEGRSPWEVAVAVREELLRYRPDGYRWHRYPPSFASIDGVEEGVVDTPRATVPVRIDAAGNGWSGLPRFLDETLGHRDRFWLVDAGVHARYGDALAELIEDPSRLMVLPAGEASKDFGRMEGLLETLLERGATRSSGLVAVGGGSTLDTAGFAAAIFMRGIPFVAVATTLLAAVDASVGGKTAANLSRAKNIPGAFFDPQGVLIPLPVVLGEIREQGGVDGAVEALKTELIVGTEQSVAELISSWRAGLELDSLARLVKRCVAVKGSVVALDPKEVYGDRMMLNLGHTFGHVVEATHDFAVSHGRAVAWGLVVASRVSVLAGFAQESLVERVTKACEALGAWPPAEEAVAQDDLKRILADKKRAGSEMTLVLLEGIGKPVLMRMSLERAENLLLSAM